MGPLKKGSISFRYRARDDQPPEITDELIAFVSKPDPACEPPRKKQKTAQETGKSDQSSKYLNNLDEEFEFIVVKEATWEVKCSGSRLSNMVVQRQNIQPRVVGYGVILRHVEIRDDKGDVLVTLVWPDDIETLRDTYNALQVSANRSGWTKEGQGKIWVEFGISLFQRDGADFIGASTRHTNLLLVRGWAGSRKP